MSHATTNYISFLNCLYNVGFLCQLLFDINWFILEYKCKKLQFIHTVDGDGFKTAKIIKRQC